MLKVRLYFFFRGGGGTIGNVLRYKTNNARCSRLIHQELKRAILTLNITNMPNSRLTEFYELNPIYEKLNTRTRNHYLNLPFRGIFIFIFRVNMLRFIILFSSCTYLVCITCSYHCFCVSFSIVFTALLKTSS